ncbi:MAG: hypothetical protein JWP25_3624 [Bradyrhizobium sp.]|nr:hypothetical protein [Bradyrhizobium sp.]
MGGKSTQDSTSQQTQNQTQNSTTAPWAVAQPALTGLLGQVQSGLGNTSLTGAENNALTTLQNNAGNFGSTYSPQIASYANTLLAGGGANNQAPTLQSGLGNYQTALNGANGAAGQTLDDYTRRLAPTANGSMIGNNPALQAQLAQVGTDVSNQVNGSFAAAGRDFSGANQMALGRGIAAGEAPVIAQQYNQDVQNQMNAANALYGAGNTTAGFQASNAGAGYGAGNTTGGLLASLQQQALANQGQGVTAAGQAADAANAGANATLAAEAQRRGVPIAALGLLANIGVPIAQLGSQSNGTSSGTSNGTSNTQSQASGAQQFAQIMGGIGSLGNLWGGGKKS